MQSPLVKRIPPEHPNETYVKRIDKLKNWRKKIAAEMDVESDVVLPRSLSDRVGGTRAAGSRKSDGMFAVEIGAFRLADCYDTWRLGCESIFMVRRKQ